MILSPHFECGLFYVQQMKKKVKHPLFGEVTLFRTGRAKRLSVSVRPPAQVRVTLPAVCPWREGLDFLAAKETWIMATLEKVARTHPVKLLLPPYATLHHTLRIDRSANATDVSCRVTASEIIVVCPASLEPSSTKVQNAVRAGVLRAMKGEAREILPVMVEELATRYGFRYGSVTVRASRSRWGSCSSRNDISLSVYLIRLPRRLIEYVIIHELCHTRYKDQSPKFHALVDSILQGRENELRKELMEYTTDVV